MTDALHAVPPSERDSRTRVLMHALWAVGQPGSGWEQMPSFVTAFNCELVDQHPDEYQDQRRTAEQTFTRLADVDDAVFFLVPMVCAYPRLPGGVR